MQQPYTENKINDILLFNQCDEENINTYKEIVFKLWKKREEIIKEKNRQAQ